MYSEATKESLFSLVTAYERQIPYHTIHGVTAGKWSERDCHNKKKGGEYTTFRVKKQGALQVATPRNGIHIFSIIYIFTEKKCQTRSLLLFFCNLSSFQLKINMNYPYFGLPPEEESMLTRYGVNSLSLLFGVMLFTNTVIWTQRKQEMGRKGRDGVGG